MARMYPERLPESVTSNAERRLFDALASSLDQHHTVYAGVRWISKKRFGALPGEADFVIVHPERGMIVLEVKGGRISFDAPSGRWHSIDRYDERHEIKNPAEQAQRNFYALCDKLREVDGRTNLRESGGYAVAFPDSAVREPNLGLDLPREIIIDSDDLSDLGASIDRAYTYLTANSVRSLSKVDLATINTALARSWEVSIPLREAMHREGARFTELTEQQFGLLNVLAGQRRALIAGCAGSGKTFLAAEKARRLAEQGFNTLLTCFNKNLAAWLRASIGPVSGNLRIQHFHELAYELTEQAGLDAGKGPGDDPSTFFKHTLPEMLLDAAETLDTRFDAIIVDEGQDFMDEWWVPLEALLTDPERGIWYVFYDEQQSIYTDGASAPFPGVPYILDTNMRSTQAIHEHLKRFYDAPVACSGPQGRPPTIVKTADVDNAIRSALHRLTVEEKVPTSDIVILTPASQQRSQWREGRRLGNLTLTWSPVHDRMQVPVCTVHSFKGLERPVVIVTEMDTVSDYQPADRLRLVAYSRAKSELIVIDGGA